MFKLYFITNRNLVITTFLSTYLCQRFLEISPIKTAYLGKKERCNVYISTLKGPLIFITLKNEGIIVVFKILVSLCFFILIVEMVTAGHFW